MALPILGRLATPPGPYSFASGKGPETRNRRNDQLDFLQLKQPPEVCSNILQLKQPREVCSAWIFARTMPCDARGSSDWSLDASAWIFARTLAALPPRNMRSLCCG